MAFKSGKEWNGNKFGAPKKQFRRDDFTEELFDESESKENVRAVRNRLFMHALDDKPWAIKLVCELAFTKPKSRDERTEEINTLVQGQLSQVPKDVLETMRSNFVDQLSKYSDNDNKDGIENE